MPEVQVGQEVFHSYMVTQVAEVTKINEDDTVDLVVTLDESGNKKAFERVKLVSAAPEIPSGPSFAYPKDEQPPVAPAGSTQPSTEPASPEGTLA